MAIIKIKRRIQGEPGPPPNLLPGELAYNEVDGILYIGVSQTNSVSSLSTETPPITGN